MNTLDLINWYCDTEKESLIKSELKVGLSNVLDGNSKVQIIRMLETIITPELCKIEQELIEADLELVASVDLELSYKGHLLIVEGNLTTPVSNIVKYNDATMEYNQDETTFDGTATYFNEDDEEIINELTFII